MLLWEKPTLQTQAPYLRSSQFLRTGQHPWLHYVPLHQSLKEKNWLVGRFLKNHRVALQIQRIGRLYRSDVSDRVHIKISALSVCQKCLEILCIVLCHKMTKLF